MSLYFIKPLVWNNINYKAPGGAKFTSGYPKQFGFGHEEWNNSDDFIYTENNEERRIFHTEQFGKQSLDDFPNDVFVLMIASHNGSQYLVGVAGCATSLLSNQRERDRLVAKFGFNYDRWHQAWALPSVKQCYAGNQRAFLNQWKKEYHWTPSWTCPSNLFLWLDTPLMIDPTSVAGKSRLVSMFGSYQSISRLQTVSIIDNIPIQRTTSGNQILSNIKAYCETADLDVATDIRGIVLDDTINSKTTRETLIQARIGQGKFRRDLFQIWNNECAVTGCDIQEVLRASHIKPWRNSTNSERLNAHNGLLLVANLDSLFDHGLISFDTTGKMFISSQLNATQQKIVGVPSNLRLPMSGLQAQAKFLSWHQANIFIP